MKIYLTDQQVREHIRLEEFNVVIENYMHIASFLAYKVTMRNYNREHQELYAVAMHAIVEGVHRMGPDHPEPFRYIHKTVSGTLKKFCKRAHLVTIPDYAPDPSFVQYMEEAVAGTSDSEDEDVGTQMTYGTHSDPNYKALAQNDLINHKFILPVEKDIIKHRLDGRTIEEIGVLCKMSTVSVQRTLDRMKAKVFSILYGEY